MDLHDQVFRCIYCGGDPLEPDHEARCDGRQGGLELEAPALGFVIPGTGPHHDGDTYEAELDHVRLNAQTLRVWDVMEAGAWLTLKQISQATGDPEASISARLRDLRKAKFGGHRVERLRVDGGLFMYRVVKVEP